MPTMPNEKLSAAPSSPGVYLMKDAAGNVMYVGKARNLKKRLASYFKNPDLLDMKTSALVKKISSFETIVTGTEQDALILESNLIKRYRPRYNVILKDDKRYPSLRLDVQNPYPCLALVRKPEKDGAMYFGPFSSSPAVGQTLKIINKTFKLRKCRNRIFQSRSRPCLNYQMGICLGPCCLPVEQAAYREIVNEVILFLKGRTPDLIQKIKQDMLTAADRQDFERAASLRDKMFALEKMLEKQVSVTTDFKDRDIIGIASSSELTLITLLFVRNGYLLGTRDFHFSETLSTDAETVAAFIRQYYEKESHFVPKEILSPLSVEDAPVMEDWLKSVKGEKVSILSPRRGEKARLIETAKQNAENRLKELISSNAARTDFLARLQAKLKMNRIPERIECFDNSNIMGTNPVAAMAVFIHGKAHKPAYRKYKIRTVAEQDDYAYMAEALKRRFGKSGNSPAPETPPRPPQGAPAKNRPADSPFEGGKGDVLKGSREHVLPDILMVDGGKGQLNIAVSVIRELNLEGKFEIIGIAKKDEKRGETEDKIFEYGRVNPIAFGKGEKDLLFFLQQIRDEAHKHAVSFHRDRRSETSLRSVLDDIPGIGKKRKQMLLKHFGSISNIRAASIEELSALPGMNRKAAEAVKLRIEN
ncbi:MAG: excinuclease ABC subunit C [Desulfobacteraceae bacterium IS3]|nr:MAG: excinuclease ABC subunit C [Desulfobacteraceae bacterium IS3]